MPISLSGSLNLSGSLTTTGTITATTLVVQTITSSISSITGSTNFGSLSSDTHKFTGSVGISGSLSGTSATFSSGLIVSNTADVYPEFKTSAADADAFLGFSNTGDGNNAWSIGRRNTGEFWISNYTGNFNSGTRTQPLIIASTGAATFTGSIGTTALNMNNMSALGSISGGSIYLPSTAKINFRSADGTTGYGEITADTSSNLIFKNNVGIGMTPDVNLQVKAISGNNTTFRIGPSASGFELSQDNGGFTVCTIKNIYGSTSNSAELLLQSGFISFKTGTSLTERMRITGDGEILMHSTSYNSANIGQLFGNQGQAYFTVNGGQCLFLNRLTSDGSILEFQKNTSVVGSISTNTYSLPSDLNFKKNINTLNLGLNLITKLRAVSYNHKIDDDDAALSTGFIAQELEQSLIELGIKQNEYYILQYKPNEDKTQSQYWVDYTKMIPILAKAIQELTARVQYLENK